MCIAEYGEAGLYRHSEISRWREESLLHNLSSCAAQPIDTRRRLIA